MNKAPARGNYFLLLIMASTSVGPKDQYDGEQKLEVIYGSPKHVCFLTTSEGDVLANETNQEPIYGEPLLGRVSVKMTCSNCRHFISTDVFYKPSWKTYAATIICTLIGCCWFPLHYKMYEDGAHFCPVCHVYLGYTGTERSWVPSKLHKIPADKESHHVNPFH